MEMGFVVLLLLCEILIGRLDFFFYFCVLFFRFISLLVVPMGEIYLIFLLKLCLVVALIKDLFIYLLL